MSHWQNRFIFLIPIPCDQQNPATVNCISNLFQDNIESQASKKPTKKIINDDGNKIANKGNKCWYKSWSIVNLKTKRLKQIIKAEDKKIETPPILDTGGNMLFSAVLKI